MILVAGANGIALKLTATMPLCTCFMCSAMEEVKIFISNMAVKKSHCATYNELPIEPLNSAVKIGLVTMVLVWNIVI